MCDLLSKLSKFTNCFHSKWSWVKKVVILSENIQKKFGPFQEEFETIEGQRPESGESVNFIEKLDHSWKTNSRRHWKIKIYNQSLYQDKTKMKHNWKSIEDRGFTKKKVWKPKVQKCSVHEENKWVQMDDLWWYFSRKWSIPT